MVEQRNGQTDGWTRRAEGQISGETNGQTDGRTDEWRNKPTNWMIHVLMDGKQVDKWTGKKDRQADIRMARRKNG